MDDCKHYAPRGFKGRWRDWHRGSGCNLDDGKPRTDDGASEIAGLGVDHPRSVAPPPPCATCGGTTWAGEPGQRVGCPDCRPEVTR